MLLGHLLFFGFIYPDKRSLVPKALVDTLLVLLHREGDEAASGLADRSPAAQPACRGTFLSRNHYRVDVEAWGFRDARLDADVRMSERDIAELTRANPGEAGIAAEV